MAFGRTVWDSHNTATDAAMVDITVRLDTSRWSTRKKNIVNRMIMSGVLDAGFKDLHGCLRYNGLLRNTLPVPT